MAEATMADRPKRYHMSSQAFRKHGHELVDWIADYHERVESLPVLSQVKPGEIRSALPEAPPGEGESFEAMMRDVEQVIMPGITHWQSPNFFAFFPANISGPSILGELLSAGLGVQGMIWATSPACTELETHVLDWIVGMLGLPDRFLSSGAGGGVIQDTASSASLCALLAARERATSFRSNREGTREKLIAYTSKEAHSSVLKAARIAGIGDAQIRTIETDEELRMRPDALAAQMRADREAGGVPFFVTATVGTTSSGAVDPVAAIAAICTKEQVWLHVDGAMAGTAALCPEFRWIHEGLETADSYCFNPHKWMFTNFDCDCFYVADREALIRTFSVLPDYLKNRATASGAVIDYRDWHVQLGRRFRALKLWFVIRHYGVQGLQHHVRRHVELAQRFAQWVDADQRFERPVSAPLNLICFRQKGSDALNLALMERLNDSGAMYLTQTKIEGQVCLRFSVGQTHTEAEHVEAAWRRIQDSVEA